MPEKYDIFDLVQIAFFVTASKFGKRLAHWPKMRLTLIANSMKITVLLHKMNLRDFLTLTRVTFQNP